MKRFLILSVIFALTVCCGRPSEVVVDLELPNPILPGFHPDPSVVAVGDDCYIVNSTFQYFPGVPIYHSRDLAHWEQVGNVLDRPSQLPLQEATSWRGIYAPTIRYDNGIYYMITTNVGNGGNFMVTATNPAGPWSEPVYLEQQGIDPSLYFEGDKCYMVSNPDGVITLCEIDPATGKTLSPSKPIWTGTGGRYPEGPHIYRKGGWYYLLISEGGTELPHRLTVARSKHIYGPYKSNPANPILTHCSQAGQDNIIQGTGHGDMFQRPDGSWWIVFLAYRRYGGDFHHLGRETFIAPVTWENGWPVVNGGKPIKENKPEGVSKRYLWDTIGPEWMHLQHPQKENYALAEGKLILTGNGDGFDWGNWHPTALLRRQEGADASIFTSVKLSSDGEAGLALYQIFCGFATLSVRRTGAKVEAVVRFKVRSIDKEEAVIPLPTAEATLEIREAGEMYSFLVNGQSIASLESPLLSSEVVGGFTGVTWGPYCKEGVACFGPLEYEHNENRIQ